jgi:hypothetical protein
MSAQIDAPKYTYLKRGVDYFVISGIILSLTACNFEKAFEALNAPTLD